MTRGAAEPRGDDTHMDYHWSSFRHLQQRSHLRRCRERADDPRRQWRTGLVLGISDISDLTRSACSAHSRVGHRIVEPRFEKFDPLLLLLVLIPGLYSYDVRRSRRGGCGVGASFMGPVERAGV